MHDGNFDNSSVDTDRNGAKITCYYKKRFKGKQCVELNCVIRKKTHSKPHKQHKTKDKNKKSRTKLVKKVSQKKSCSKIPGVQNTHNKFVSVDYRTYRIKPRKKQPKIMYPTAWKPVSYLCVPSRFSLVYSLRFLNPILELQCGKTKTFLVFYIKSMYTY